MTAAAAGGGGEWERLFPAAARPAPAVLILTAAQADTIRAAAAAAYPHEGCGLLAGVEEGAGEGMAAAGRVTRVVAAANVAPRAHDRFEIDPRAQLDVMKTLRGTAERLLGHWHSHPDHPPIPSATDLAQAWEAGLVWIICPVTPAGPGSLAAWRLMGEGSDRRFEPVSLRIEG